MVGNLRCYLTATAVLLALAGPMLLVQRANQIPLSLIYTVFLPLLILSLTVIFYIRTPRATDHTSPYTLEMDLLVLSFLATTAFWALIMGVIEYTTPIGDTGGMLFMMTLLPGAFDFWWPGLALSLGPEFGSRHPGSPARAQYLWRLATGCAGGVLAGIPLYGLAMQWDNVPVFGL